jgi:hypothetical protein
MFDIGLNLPLEVPDEVSGDVRYLVATIHTMGERTFLSFTRHFSSVLLSSLVVWSEIL